MRWVRCGRGARHHLDERTSFAQLRAICFEAGRNSGSPRTKAAGRQDARCVLSADAKTAASEVLRKLHAQQGLGFANARTVRTLFEQMLAKQSNRLAIDVDLNKEDLTLLNAADMPLIGGLQ
jgi:hypothetical protein